MGGYYSLFFVFLTALKNRGESFDALKLDLYKPSYFIAKMLAKKMHNNFQPFSSIFFFFYKQIKKMGWKVFLKNLPPHLFLFAYTLYFIGAGGDENLKKSLIWPYMRQTTSANNILRCTIS